MSVYVLSITFMIIFCALWVSTLSCCLQLQLWRKGEYIYTSMYYISHTIKSLTCMVVHNLLLNWCMATQIRYSSSEYNKLFVSDESQSVASFSCLCSDFLDHHSPSLHHGTFVLTLRVTGRWSLGLFLPEDGVHFDDVTLLYLSCWIMIPMLRIEWHEFTIKVNVQRAYMYIHGH